MRNALLTAALLMWTVPEAAAHHSFAVFFDDTKSVTVSGSVTHFRFTNPHAIIEITRKTPQGQIETWRAETNAVTLLRRRGWTAESLKIGEMVTIDGWPPSVGLWVVPQPSGLNAHETIDTLAERWREVWRAASG